MVVCIYHRVSKTQMFVMKLGLLSCSIFFLPILKEVPQVFCWNQGVDCLVFCVHLGMFFNLAWGSVIKVAQSCSMCHEARPRIYGIFPKIGDDPVGPKHS